MQDYKINLLKIESRLSQRFPNDYEFLIEVSSKSTKLDAALEDLKAETQYLQIISRDKKQEECVPWFPRRIKDLDCFANNILSYGSELDADHPVSGAPLLALSDSYDRITLGCRDSKMKHIEPEGNCLQT